MVSLYIFRHGQTRFSKYHIPYGKQIESAELIPEGFPAIKRLAEYLKNIPTDANFSSPYRRCKQTTGMVSEITGKKFAFDERLHDWVPGKEEKGAVITRTLDFAKEIEKTSYQSVAICTHGYPINALIAYFTKGFIREADLENHPECGVLSIVEDKKVIYKDFNN